MLIDCFLIRVLFFESTDCFLAEVTINISVDNELTVNWTTEGVTLLCNFYQIRIELELKDCGNLQCIENIDGIPLANLSLKLPNKLVACASYEIRFYETDINKDGPTVTEEFESNEIFQKFEIEVEKNDPTSLYISWSYEDYPLCSKKFQIKVLQDNVVFKSFEITKSTETMIDDLEPCETYYITVYPMQNEEVMTLYGGSINYTMDSAQPGPIRDFKVEYNDEDESIDVSWLAPDFAAKCINNYSIRADSDYDNKTRSSNGINLIQKTNFPNVFACVFYTIKINADTIHGKKGEESFKEILIPSRGKNISWR